MKIIIFSALMGVILAICGITAFEWQFYAILIPIDTFIVFLTK